MEVKKNEKKKQRLAATKSKTITYRNNWFPVIRFAAQILERKDVRKKCLQTLTFKYHVLGTPQKVKIKTIIY